MKPPALMALISVLASAPALAQTQPSWVQTNKVLPAAGWGSGDNYFGRSSALEEGLLLIGAPGEEGFPGEAYLFAPSQPGVAGVDWVEFAQLRAHDGAPDDDFGRSVAHDGVHALIGAPLRASGSGAAYLFRRTSVGWSEIAKFTRGPESSDALFGRSVAIAGSMALVGAPGEDLVYVFQQVANGWATTGVLTPPRSASGFGYSIDFDGSIAIVGAPDEEAVFVFRHSYDWRFGWTWSLLDEIVTPDSSGGLDNFGAAVARSGSTLLVGAPADKNDGRAYAFEQFGNDWIQTATFARQGLPDSCKFGTAVAIDGSIAVIGAPGVQTREGSACVFEQHYGNWEVATEILPDIHDAGEGSFGLHVAVHGESLFVNIGLDDAPVFGAYAGAMNVFRRPPGPDTTSKGEGETEEDDGLQDTSG